MLIGVLALQGDFIEHIHALAELGVAAIEVRTELELQEVSGLIIPGGESLTLEKLLVLNNLKKPLQNALKKGLPVFGTCAGAIILSREIIGSNEFSLKAIDVSTQRNAFGSQIDSFVEKINSRKFGSFEAVFIRAPKFKNIGKNVDVLAFLGKEPVLCEQGNVLIASFHPELTGNLKIHKYFVGKCMAFKKF